MAIQTTTTVRNWWQNYRCAARTDSTRIDETFTMWGKQVGGVPILATQAFNALEVALTYHGYNPILGVWVERLCSQGGIGNKPCLPSGSGCSLHNYRLAIDIEPKVNPQTPGDPFAGKLQRHHVEAVTKIKNSFGEQVWTWGGYWSLPDRMHFQINVPPSRTLINWETVDGGIMANDHEHVVRQPIGERDWASGPWGRYVAAGGSSVPASRVYETNREDVAWLWDWAVRPLAVQVGGLTRIIDTVNAELVALRISYSEVQARLKIAEAAVNAGGARLSALEANSHAPHETSPDLNVLKSGDTVRIERL